MHRKILTSGIALAMVLGFGACEKHDWEKTQTLHQPHHGHGDHGEGDHHGESGDHADPHHGEKGEGHGDAHHGDEAKAEKAHGDEHHDGDKEAHAPKEKAPAKSLGE